MNQTLENCRRTHFAGRAVCLPVTNSRERGEGRKGRENSICAVFGREGQNGKLSHVAYTTIWFDRKCSWFLDDQLLVWEVPRQCFWPAFNCFCLCFVAAILHWALRLVLLPDVQEGDLQPVCDPQRQNIPAQGWIFNAVVIFGIWHVLCQFLSLLISFHTATISLNWPP